MAEVTVKQLAETVGRPVETLLTQMQEAGLAHKNADDAVSDVEKQQLLVHLKRAHGDSESEPKKITLKRKETSTLKVAPSAGGKAKTVNVEVRKTRSYVKQSVLDGQDDAARAAEEAERKVEEERLAAEALRVKPKKMLVLLLLKRLLARRLKKRAVRRMLSARVPRTRSCLSLRLALRTPSCVRKLLKSVHVAKLKKRA
jgi:hypothetical protein